jgi:hypothetical protein
LARLEGECVLIPSIGEMQDIKESLLPAVVTAGASETRARHEVPVLTSLGLRTAAAADLSASLARLLGPLLDVLIRLWLAEGFLMTVRHAAYAA